MDIRDSDEKTPGDVYIDWRSSQVRAEIDRLRLLRSAHGQV